MRRQRLVGTCAALLLGALVVCDYGFTGAFSLNLNRAGDPTAGAKIFASAGCGDCHTFAPAGATGKSGSNLDKLQLDSAAAAAVIAGGRNGMPSFSGRLTTTQIADLAAYLVAPAGVTPPSSPTPKIAKLAIRVVDARLTLSPAVVASGRIAVRVRNAGKHPHSLMIMRVAPSLRLLASLRPIRPGTVISRAMVLRPGSYLFATGLGRTDRKMLALLRVRATSVGASPASDPATGAAPASPAPGSAASASTAPGDAANGARLFSALGCGACHRLAAAGATGTSGPNLDLSKPTAGRIVAVLEAGGAGMPSFGNRASAQEILDLAAFINSASGAGAGSGSGAAPGAGGSVPPSAGAQVFASAGCGGCHVLAAAGAAGAAGPNLDVMRPSPNQVVTVVTAGKGTMPGYSGRLTATQIQDVATFVSSVAGTGAAGGGSTGGGASGPPGLQLFQRGGCGSCHTLAAAGATGRSAPNLDREHPSAKNVVEAVTKGPDEMPSYTTVYTAAEMQELGKWIESVTRGG